MFKFLIGLTIYFKDSENKRSWKEWKVGAATSLRPPNRLEPTIPKRDLKSNSLTNLTTPQNMTRGGFHKSWVHSVKRVAHPKLGENAISWAQGVNTWCQIRVNLYKKDGRRAQMSRVGRKLLYEIHPRSGWESNLGPPEWQPSVLTTTPFHVN